MNRFISIATTTQLEAIQSLQGLLALSPKIFAQHKPDAHWVLVQNDMIRASCSLWWRNTPAYLDHQVGLIGHYQAEDNESAALLLNHACQQLTEQNCTIVIAPMDGNTWRRYRFIIDRGSEPIFFLEPDNPDQWINHFQDQEFTVLANYQSSINTDLTYVDPRMEKIAARMHDLGVQIRSIDLANFETELERIYQLSSISFRHNFLYTPIDRAEFITQYLQVKPYVKPELTLLAEHQHQLVGFLFAVPDISQSQRGQTIDTAIIKTVAALPGKTYAGLGSLLVSQAQSIARQLGYQRVIHALMHDANNSRNLSRHYAHPIRRYSLFSKNLIS
jgi:predicted N-acetyltransferase YhbS